MDAISSATGGMIWATQRLNTVAANVANGSDDSAVSAVGQVSVLNDFKASAAVVKAQDEMMQTLLDIRV